MEEQNKSVKSEKSVVKKMPPIDFGKIWNDLRKYKRLYVKVLGITAILAVIITLSLPNYYNCTVKLSPEMSGMSSTSGLASLASSFGVDIGGAMGKSTDAIFPTLYPDLMNSVDFKTSLFNVTVTIEGKDGEKDRTMLYYDYLRDEQKKPWWTAALEGGFKLFGEKKEDTKINPFRLTKEQYGIVKFLDSRVSCAVDKKTMVISINVTDQDPVICANMADTVKNRLQKFITDYRTNKARVDLEYNKKIYQETKVRYEKARQR